MSLILVDRFRPRLRREQQAAIDAGRAHVIDELALLEPEQLRPLAFFSLLMLIIGGMFFGALTLAVLLVRERSFQINFGFWSIALWVIANIAAYIVVLPLHEAVHALAFALWGGRPYFGAKLPLALYCGAKNQLFRRDQYLVVGLAPLVVITLAGIVLTLLAPIAASYVLLGTIGNVSGAAGDVWTALRLWRQPRHILIEDTQTGYRSWEIG